MSEASTQAAAPARRTSGGGASPFTRQVGPLPMWGWMGLLLAAAVVYSQWHKNKAAAAAANTNTAGTVQDSSQTPPFIIQNYTSYPGTGAQGPQGPPGPTGPPGASGTGSTGGVWSGGANHPGGPVSSPPSTPTPTPPPVSTTTNAQPVVYRVQPGDTLTSIAAKYHVPGGWQALYNYNIGTGPGTANRDASTIATLKQRGPNLIYSNEAIYIPT